METAVVTIPLGFWASAHLAVPVVPGCAAGTSRLRLEPSHVSVISPLLTPVSSGERASGRGMENKGLCLGFHRFGCLIGFFRGRAQVVVNAT
jgi:hypothetical protein